MVMQDKYLNHGTVLRNSGKYAYHWWILTKVKEKLETLMRCYATPQRHAVVR